MRKKIRDSVILILSLLSLVISLKIFYNLGFYVDEVNINPSVVLGGDIWLLMSWLNFVILGIILVVAGINLLKKEK